MSEGRLGTKATRHISIIMMLVILTAVVDFPGFEDAIMVVYNRLDSRVPEQDSDHIAAWEIMI